MTARDDRGWSPLEAADIERIAASPFSARRPYFDSREFDRIAHDALAAAGCLPEAPGPVRIERFIEKRFDITPRYERLSEGVLGTSWFSESGIDRVIVSDAIERRRQNSTLAHEAGHLLLHTEFVVAGIRALGMARSFGQSGADGANVRGWLCRDEPDRRSGPWWEYQANQMIGALLLPRDLAASALRERKVLVPRGALGDEAVDGDPTAAAAVLSPIFDVHPVVAEHRIGSLWPAPPGGQLTLG